MTAASAAPRRRRGLRSDALPALVLAAALLAAGPALPLVAQAPAAAQTHSAPPTPSAAQIPSAAQTPVADTVGMPRLFASIGMQGAHVSAGTGRVPYQDGAGSTVDLRLGLTARALPEWTVAVAVGFVANARPTAYEVPGMNGFRPDLWTSAGGIEVQRRWTGARRYHPIATVGVGTVSNSYRYKTLSADGELTWHTDELHQTSYLSAGAGGEVRIARGVRASGIAAYRAAGPVEVPHGRGTNRGVTMFALLSAGWF